MNKINFFNTHIDDTAKEAVIQVLESTFLSEGKLVADFESALSTKCGIVNPVSLNSGTAALHLALVTAGIGVGDEVILPAQTFIATGLSILMTGATPVFADIQLETGNIDPNDVSNKITSKTKVIMPVHWGGYPCDMDELIALAAANNLLIVEDAAHAIGATYKNRNIGSISDFTCFSFQAIKHLTTGDGGALSCKVQEHWEKALALRWFGIDRKNSPINLSGERQYNLGQIGYKYHLNNYAAALGLANLNSLASNIMRRREIATFYDNELINTPGIKLFDYSNDRQSAYWLYGFHVENREAFILKLRKNNVPASIVHAGINKNDIFKFSQTHLPNQEKFDSTQIHIPVHNGLSDSQVQHIIKSITSGW